MERFKTPPLKVDELIAKVKSLGHQVYDYQSTFAQSVNADLDGNSKLDVLVPIISDRKYYTVGEVTTTFIGEVGEIESEKHFERTEVFYELCKWFCEEHGDPRMLPIEFKEFKKAGPYVNASAMEISEKFLSYFKPDFQVSKDLEDKLETAARKVGQSLRKALGSTQDILPLDFALANITKGRHFGAPYFTSQWGRDYNPANPDAFMVELERVARGWENCDDMIVDYVYRLPATLFSRTVPDGRSILSAAKKRVTFAPSKFEAIIGKRLSYPIIDAFKHTDFALGYGGNEVIEPYLQRAIHNADHVLSLDYSGFDQCAKRKAREYVGIALKEVFAPKWHFYIDLVIDLHHNPNINTPFGVVSINPNSDNVIGLQSGLGLTGVYGTLWNRILASVMVSDLRERYSISDVKHFCYGDDTLMTWRGDFIDALDFEDYLSQFGMHANAAKQEYASGNERYGVLCQKYFFYYPPGTKPFGPATQFEDGSHVSKGIHSLCRMMPKLVYKDVTQEGESAIILDAKSEASKNGAQIIEVFSALEELKNHPAFKPLVGAIMEVHPLKLATREVFNHKRRQNRDQYVECSGIENFQSVQTVLSWEEEHGLPELYADGYSLSCEVDFVVEKMKRWQQRYYKKWLVYPTIDQLRGKLNGQHIEMNEAQVKYRQYQLTARDGKHPSVRVTEFQQKKGIVLNAYQRSMLLRGDKIQYNDEQVVQMSIWGSKSTRSPEELQALVYGTEIRIVCPTRFIMPDEVRTVVKELFPKVVKTPVLPDWTPGWIF